LNDVMVNERSSTNYWDKREYVAIEVHTGVKLRRLRKAAKHQIGQSMSWKNFEMDTFSVQVYRVNAARTFSVNRGKAPHFLASVFDKGN